MNIKTKADVGDKVFFIYNSDIYKEKIKIICIKNKKNKTLISYELNSGIEIDESEIFETSAELYRHIKTKVLKLDKYKTDDSEYVEGE